MLLLTLNQGTLNPTESINLETVFSQCTCFVKHHHVDSTGDIDPLRRDTEYLLSFQARNSKCSTGCHRSWKSRRDSNGNQIQASVDDVRGTVTLGKHILKSCTKASQGNETHTKDEFQRVLIELKLARLGIEYISD